MHRQQRLRLGRDSRCHLGGVHLGRAGQAVHEDGRRPEMAHRLGSGDERVHRQDDLVSGLHTGAEQRQLDGIGA